MNFLLGTGLSIAFAGTGAYAIDLFEKQRPTPACLVMVATLAGTIALAIWIRREGEKFLKKFPERKHVVD